jgi:hypothetical protein
MDITTKASNDLLIATIGAVLGAIIVGIVGYGCSAIPSFFRGPKYN